MRLLIAAGEFVICPGYLVAAIAAREFHYDLRYLAAVLAAGEFDMKMPFLVPGVSFAWLGFGGACQS